MPASETYPIRSFLDYLIFQKRYSEHTIIAYENDLTAFFDFLLAQYHTTAIEEITTPLVRSWLASLKEKKMDSRSVNRKISTLKSFFKYQLRNGVITVSPVNMISTLKAKRKLPSFIIEENLAGAMQSLQFSETFGDKTTFLIMEILYHTGIRRSELIHLKEHHVDMHNATIKVLGKGNKERLIPVHPQLLRYIQEYIAEKRHHFPGVEGGTLLVSNSGKTLNPRSVYAIVKQALAAATRGKKSPHVLRHSFATHLTNHGAQINAVKELLGHSSLAATQIYTHNTIDKLKEVYKQAHPKS